MKILLSIVILLVLMAPSSTFTQPDILNWIKSINVSTTYGNSYDLYFGCFRFKTDGYVQGYCSNPDYLEYNYCIDAGYKCATGSATVAERVGFEPTLHVSVNTLSKRAPSATRPPLLNKLFFYASGGGGI